MRLIWRKYDIQDDKAWSKWIGPVGLAMTDNLILSAFLLMRALLEKKEHNRQLRNPFLITCKQNLSENETHACIIW